jgi:2-dehydropantoate 2-reductase
MAQTIADHPSVLGCDLAARYNPRRRLFAGALRKQEKTMRVLVFGAGAIGSLLGHRLASAGHEVTLVARREYVDVVRTQGLCLEEGQRDSTVHPLAVENLAELKPGQRTWDVVLLTVKVYDTSEAAVALAPLLAPSVPMLIVQNGVGGEELAREVLGNAPILSGVATLSVSVLAPGRVRLETTRGGLSLSSMQEGQNVECWASVFAGTGLKTAIYRDYRAMKWSKLLLNMQANALPAILDMVPGAVLAEPALFALERTAFLEALTVIKALGLRPDNLPGYPVPLLVWAMRTWPVSLLRPLLQRLIGSGRGDKKPSLHLDLARGRPYSEVLYLNGAVAAHAQRAGLPVPVNQFLLDTMLGIATGALAWDTFRGQPAKVIAMLH